MLVVHRPWPWIGYCLVVLIGHGQPCCMWKVQPWDLPGRLVEGALFCCGWMSLSRLLPVLAPLRLSLCLIEDNMVFGLRGEESVRQG